MNPPSVGFNRYVRTILILGIFIGYSEQNLKARASLAGRVFANGESRGGVFREELRGSLVQY